MKGLIVILLFVLAIGMAPANAAGGAETLSVEVKKEKRFAKSKLLVQFVEVVEDSRCPADVNCIWAGNAKIRVRVIKDGRSHELTLETNGPQTAVSAEGYSFKLVGLTPYPGSAAAANRDPYIATLEAVKTSR